MTANKTLQQTAFLLSVTGALNWGLIGAFDVNLVNSIFGTAPQIENLVYILVGLSALYLLGTHEIVTGGKRK